MLELVWWFLAAGRARRRSDRALRLARKPPYRHSRLEWVLAHILGILAGVVAAIAVVAVLTLGGLLVGHAEHWGPAGKGGALIVAWLVAIATFAPAGRWVSNRVRPGRLAPRHERQARSAEQPYTEQAYTAPPYGEPPETEPPLAPPSPDPDDLYDRLQVAPHTSPAVIDAAWRHLARDAHPDHGGDPELFKSYEQAYAVLGDPPSRAAYDRARRE